MPEIPQVQTCCFCWSTELGSKIIGWWLLISGIVQTVGSIILLIGSLGKKAQADAIYLSGSTGEYIFDLIVSLLVVLMGLYLLFGVYKRNMRYLRTWLTAATIYLVLLIIGILGLVLSGNPNALNQIINVLLVSYFIVVVYSFYKENENSPPQTY